jgi:hypothetical protein
MIDPGVLEKDKSNLEELAEKLSEEEVGQLVALLESKEDDVRYPAFLLLQKRSEIKADIYPYWDELAIKMDDANSYQRSIGCMLIAENVRWDHENRFGGILKAYLAHCHDERFITSRQTIQSIHRWLPLHPEHFQAVIETLLSIDVEALKDTQRKLILADILEVFLEIQAIRPSRPVLDYLMRAMTGGLADRKTIRRIEEALEHQGTGPES